MSSTAPSRSRSTRRCAAAAAGFAMVLASFAGAAASATAATHRSVIVHINPHIVSPGSQVGASSTTVQQYPVATLIAGTSVVLPTVTVTDPGVIPSGNTVTLRLITTAANVSLDTTATPTVSATGATSGPVTVTGNQLGFTVTKAATAAAASYVVSGIHLVGTTTATSGAIAFSVDGGPAVVTPPCSGRFTVAGCAPNSGSAPVPATPTPQITAPTFDVGAVTHLVPALYGAPSPDTAASLFRSTIVGHNPTAAVLVSDAEPQDAESANYLSGALSHQNPVAPILLTDPTTLSSAVSSVLSDHPGITDVYIVGGTSVVSAAIQAQLEADHTVIRLAGITQYDTNSEVDNYVAQNLPAFSEPLAPDYSQQSRYNSTSGTSSADTTGVGSVKTAVVASGDIDSYQDGLVSGPLSVLYGLPVMLTTPSALSSTARALLAEGRYKQVILLGGPLAVSNAVESQLTASTESGGAGVVVFRVAGADASDTSTKLAAFLDVETRQDFHAVDQGTFDGGVLIARGNGFQDALAAGPYGGLRGFTPILLTENADTLGAPLTAYLRSLGEQCIYAAQAVGGPFSVPAAVQKVAIDAEYSGLTGCVPQLR